MFFFNIKLIAVPSLIKPVNLTIPATSAIFTILSSITGVSADVHLCAHNILSAVAIHKTDLCITTACISTQYAFAFSQAYKCPLTFCAFPTVIRRTFYTSDIEKKFSFKL